MVDFKKTSLSESVKKINAVIREINGVIDWVKTSIIAGRKDEKETWTEKYSAFIEYIILYVIATLSVSSALGFFVFPKPDWSSVGIIATVMLSTILLGTAKYILGRKIRRQSMKIEGLEETNKALETALGANMIERTKERTQTQKLLEHVKLIDPSFDLSTLFLELEQTTPHKIKPLTVDEFCDEQNESKQKKSGLF